MPVAAKKLLAQLMGSIRECSQQIDTLLAERSAVTASLLDV
jgi:hypothetical protein